MKVRRSVRARLAAWIAVLVTVSGAVVVVIVVLLARQRLHDVAAANPDRAAPQPAATPGGPEISLHPGPTPVDQARGRAADHAFHEVELDGFLVLAGSALASVLVGWVVSDRMLRPLRRLESTVHGIASTDLAGRIALTGPDDELKRVGDAFDAMLDRLEATFAAQQAFVADASHELRTPLAVLRAEVDVALDDPDATTPEFRDALEAIGAATGRAQALAEALLVLAASDAPPSLQPVDLADCARRAVAGAERVGLGDRQLSVGCEPAPVTGDAVRLERAVANLLENALRYNVPGGTVSVQTGRRDRWSFVIVANDGPAVDPAEVDGLFERFRRREDSREAARGGPGAGGFGLGLAIVASTVHAHGGQIQARARPEGGLAVTVRLPEA